MVDPVAVPAMAERITPRAWGAMATVCVAQVLEVLGVTVVIVALPAIGADLGLDDARLQLVVSLYAVLYGGLLLTAAAALAGASAAVLLRTRAT